MFRFTGEVIRGVMTYRRANRAIVEHRLWPFLIVPGFMSMFYVIALIMVGRAYFPEIAAYLYELMPHFLQWDAVRLLLTFFLWVLLFLTGYITYQPIILVIFSPLLSYLSEVTEARVYGHPGMPFSMGQLLKDMLRALMISLRNLVRLVFFLVFAWLFIIVPLVGAVISAVLVFLIQAYYNGFALTDYTLERKRYSVGNSVRFVRRHRPRVIGVGIGFMLMMLIPVLGWFMAPAYGTVAATLASVDLMERDLVV